MDNIKDDRYDAKMIIEDIDTIDDYAKPIDFSNPF
jgi:hypothetical protein